MFLTSKADDPGTAISSDSIKDFLDVYQISYREEEEIVEEKKFPVLNVVLAAAIVILLILVIREKKRGRSIREYDECSSKKRSRKRSGKNKKTDARKNLNMPRASLEFPAEKRLVMIHKTAFLIGREQAADFFFVGQQEISRRHACIWYENKDFYLSDLQSRNHTFLNGSQLIGDEKRLLRDGDEIMVGHEKLIFHMKFN
jgi:hypothetical protein